MLQEAQTSDWVVAICSILFDLDVGQKVELVQPPGALTAEEQTDVAFHCFPDSMSMELYSRSSIRDSTFFFRIKRRGSSVAGARPDAELRPHSTSASTVSSIDQHYADHQVPFLYGFVFCRQRQDERLKRGGEQKSVVVLSRFPYSSVLGPLSQYVGPLYFNQGSTALQQVYSEVLTWEPPQADLRSVVDVGTLSIMAQVPAPACLPPPAPPDSSHPLACLPSLDEEDWEGLHGVFSEADVYSPFKAVLDKLWALWEMVALGLPLMVTAPSPGESSAAVAALLSLISPLPYSADFRPYFTIHDPDFAAMSAAESPEGLAGVPRLLGVTNLYFLKALPDWPNVLSIGSKPSLAGSAQQNGHTGPSAAPSAPSRLQKLGNAVKAVRQQAAGAQVLLTQHIQALWSSYKPLTRPDNKLLERLLRVTPADPPAKAARIALANSAALHHHFTELTLALLEPFAQFCTPVLPPEGDGPVPLHGPPHLPAFSHAAFLQTLQEITPRAILLERFSSQGQCVQFYKRFLESANFTSWFERRRQAAWSFQETSWELARTGRGEDLNLEALDEVQLVEVFHDMEARLEEAAAVARHPAASQQALAKAALLKKQVGAIFGAMPRDLQQTMLSSPQRAALLHGLTTQHKVPGQPLRRPSVLPGTSPTSIW
ncbi:hypothetical protein WJX72_006112 [[Myrmecia] bisecta]|uniref:UDENN domain-containing protein n=1 Tax=[Myrmecia] bisecta TaxID=41462 RepID=A0AAW1PKR2_9CHLO